jgi:hypothetical protein
LITNQNNSRMITIRKTPCPPPLTRSTATLMKTGQTTSYRTGDDGDIEAGRATNFTTLDTAPVHNDGSATINTTTNRFTDTLGGQTYADNIVLDWSTWNGSTLLGWYRVGVRTFAITWEQAIDFSIAETYGTFAGWRICNKTEAHSIINHQTSLGLNYAPFNVAVNREFWTSTTNPTITTQAFTQQANGFNTARGKTGNQFAYPVRTFSLSTSNILS